MIKPDFVSNSPKIFNSPNTFRYKGKGNLGDTMVLMKYVLVFIKGRSLLEGNTCLVLSVNGAAHIGGKHLFDVRRLLKSGIRQV